ncbi:MULTISPECIES: lectin MOA-related protein [Burkholderia cepacia complex]|uniref:Agglutinin C-terminal domain-containing protein n=1 Tax=Burkholderia contaminans TaxID=488447 RepID=A0A6P3BU57_9BURK|nr:MULTISPECIES: lectin MOA-related protein [Burkholderia cepacia complex]VWD59096.1 hypothetical protein BCO71033_06286 [Burkholderia contaminans]
MKNLPAVELPELFAKFRPGERRDIVSHFTPTIAQQAGITPHLSEPIPVELIDATTPYLLVDESNRILLANDRGVGAWQWAFVGSYSDYASYVLGTSFGSDPALNPAPLYLGPPQNTKYLQSNGSSSSWDWVFWADSSYKYPTVSLKTQAISSQTFKLIYKNNSTEMGLCADSGSWNWVYVGNTSSYTPLTLTARKFFLGYNDLKKLFAATWPNASITDWSFRVGDKDYELLHQSKAQQIYNDSGLSKYKWVEEVFDCDDFSYAYKAQASRVAYEDYKATGNAVQRSYASGVVFGRKPDGTAHAVNVFVDYTCTVKILEPQNGSIIDGKDWAYTPYFILF